MWSYTKLTKAQKAVVDLIRQGWELGEERGLNPRWWLQKNGLGRGGDAKEVRLTTGLALYYKGVISAGTRSYPTQQHYILNTKDENVKS